MGKIELELMADEGFRSRVYEDTRGNKTIGFGWNLENGINKDLALLVMKFQLKETQEELSYRLEFWNRLSRNRQDVLVNIAFNVGVPGLMEFEKMLSAMAEENWSRAKYELLDSNAARELHNRYNRLADRMMKG